MTALSRDAIRKSRGQLTYKELPIASGETIYVGGLVSVLASGTGSMEAYPASDTANHRIAGVATSVNDDFVTVAYGGEFEFDIASDQQAVSSLGLNLSVVDDNTVGSGSVGNVLVGELRSFSNEAETKGWVAVRCFSPYDVA